jgi:hypothetical protein
MNVLSKGIYYTFKCSQYQWHITYAENNNLVDDFVYPIAAHLLFYKSMRLWKLEKNPYYLMDFYFHENSLLCPPFEGDISCYAYICFQKFKMVKSNDVVYFFSRDHYLVDGLKHYLEDIKIFVFLCPSEIKKTTTHYLDKQQINYLILKQPWTNQELFLLENKDMDVGIIDILLEIEEITGIYSFFYYLPFLIYLLRNLKKGGHLLLNTSLITNKMFYDFILALSCHFQKSFIYEPDDDELQIVGRQMYSLIIFLNYDKKFDIDKLLEINKKIELFPTARDILLLELTMKSEPSIFLQKIVKIKDEMKEVYHSYRYYLRKKFLRAFYQLITWSVWKNHKEKYPLFQEEAIVLAKKYHLPVCKWVKNIPDHDLRMVFSNYLISTKEFFYERMNPTQTKVEPSSSLDIHEEGKELAFMKFIYQYAESKKYQLILELFSENLVKEEFYMLLKSTHLLDSYSSQKKEINALHLCTHVEKEIIKYLQDHHIPVRYHWKELELNNQEFLQVYKKYHHIDLIISDCGSFTQMSYDPLLLSLLVPREGGCFVCRSFTLIDDLFYLSLIYLLNSFYGIVYIYKSYTHFWSPDVYLIGMDKKALSSDEIEKILEVAKSLSSAKFIYPVPHISENFYQQYYHLMMDIVAYYLEMRNFYEFLVNNYPLSFCKEVLKIKTQLLVKKYLTGGKIEDFQDNLILPNMDPIIYKMSQLHQRIKYDNKVKDIFKLGQLKLFFTELFYLTYWANPNNKVLYVGAANGYHIGKLAELFPDLQFDLWDPSEFEIKESDNIRIFNTFFTNETAGRYIAEGHNILFMSDIRTIKIAQLIKKGDIGKIDTLVSDDMKWQKDWVKIIRPKSAYLKFRLPYEVASLDYLAGTIYLQPYAPWSTETRLMTTDYLTEIPYDCFKNDEQMAYFNQNLRTTFKSGYWKKEMEENHIFNNWDNALALYITHYYLRKKGMNDKKDACQLFLEIIAYHQKRFGEKYDIIFGK